MGTTRVVEDGYDPHGNEPIDMSHNLHLYTKSLYTLDAVAQRVPADAWDNPSPCDVWSARQVAGHAGWLIKNLGSIAASEGTIPDHAEELVLGNHPAKGMRAIVETTLSQLDQPGSLAMALPIPWAGLNIVDDFIGEVWIDAVVHAWDLAEATGIAHGIDDITAQTALSQIEAMSASHLEDWELGSVQTPSDQTPLARLMARAGRTSMGSLHQ